jgi:hypothetical protein
MSAANILNENIAARNPPDDLQLHRDPRSLTSLNEILSCLSWYQSAEAELSNSLTDLLSNRQSIDKSLQQLQTLVPRLDELRVEAANFSTKVSATAQTAERVGGRVRSLDEEMRRVGEAADRVGQVMELKVCSKIPSACFLIQLIFLCSLLLFNCRLPLTAKTGNRLLDIVRVPCLCPLKSFRVPLQSQSS